MELFKKFGLGKAILGGIGLLISVIIIIGAVPDKIKMLSGMYEKKEQN